MSSAGSPSPRWSVLVVLGLPRWWRLLGRRDAVTLAACWTVGLLAALVTWAIPDAVGWVAAHVPGGGLLRDGSRLLLLCAPAVATVSGVAVARVADLLDAGAARTWWPARWLPCPSC